MVDPIAWSLMTEPVMVDTLTEVCSSSNAEADLARFAQSIGATVAESARPRLLSGAEPAPSERRFPRIVRAHNHMAPAAQAAEAHRPNQDRSEALGRLVRRRSFRFRLDPW